MTLRRIALATTLIPFLGATALAQTAPPAIHSAGTIDLTTPIPVPLATASGQQFMKDGSVSAPDPKPEKWQQPNLTYGHAIMQALCSDRANGDDAHEDAMAKIKRCNTGVKIQDDPAYTPNTNDRLLIEAHIGVWPALVGREIIEFVAPGDLK